MLSVCIITKNEESNILRCINSVKNIADEIIVVDTGSTDKTVSIATSLGAKIFFKKWNDDFSDARNYALEKATKEWILSIDADEVLNTSDHNKLKEVLSKSKKEGIYLNLRNLIKGSVINEISSLRLFKNKKEYRYRGKLHEQIYFAIEENAGKEAFEVTDIELNHYGYDHNNIDMGKKIERNVDVLNKYAEKDKDGFYYFSLGSEYLKLNDTDKAMECFEKAEYVKSNDYGYKPYLAVSMVQIYLQTKKYKSGLKCLERFNEELDGFRELYFLDGALNSEMKNYSKSYNSLVRFIQTAKDSHRYPSFNFEESNNINDLINGLNTLKVDHNPNMLSTVIDLTENDEILEVLLSVNEISENVYIIDNNFNNNLKESLYEYGAVIVDKSDNIKPNTEWTLKIQEKLILSKQNHEDIIRIVSHLKTTNEIKYRGNNKLVRN